MLAENFWFIKNRSQKNQKRFCFYHQSGAQTLDVQTTQALMQVVWRYSNCNFSLRVGRGEP